MIRTREPPGTELPPAIHVHAVGKSADKPFISRYFYRIYFCRCCQLRGIRAQAIHVRRGDSTQLPHLGKPAYQWAISVHRRPRRL